MWQFWLIVSGVFLIAEIITTGFLLFWLAIGALITMIVSLFTDNIIIQSSVFLLSSTALIFATKPLVRKLFNSKDNAITNAYSIIGKMGVVSQEIDSVKNIGQVKINSEVWSAKTESDSPIPKGTKVKVIKIDGVKVVVAITETVTL